MPRTKNPNKVKKGFLDGYKTYDTSEGFGSSFEWRSAFKYRMGLSEARSTVGADSPRGILGVETGCKVWVTIRNAYRELVRKLHPDLNPEITDTAPFRKVQGAYEILEDQARREGWWTK